MAQSFIGKPISLISHSDVRYRGTLAGIDPQASTIQLENVFSMGTETRRPPQQYIAPVQEPYAYIIFRASEVKDLSVDDQPPALPPQHNVHDDPAVLGASAPIVKPAYQTYASQASTSIPAQHPQAPPQQQVYPPRQQLEPGPAVQGQPQAARGPQQQNVNNARRPNPLHTATASLETVERAMSDLRVNGPSQHGGGRGGGRRGRGGRAGGNGGAEVEQIKVPTTDFDFEGSNAKFDKSAGSGGASGGATAKESTSSEGSGSEAEKEKEDKKEPVAYNPQKSFFDSLSSGSAAPAGSGAAGSAGGAHQGGGGRGRRGGGGGGGGMGRNRREEEREKNVATFGEPGGVGLLGPGGYVGGWGGYGRRGGRPRRGAGRGGAGAGPQAAVARG